MKRGSQEAPEVIWMRDVEPQQTKWEQKGKDRAQNHEEAGATT